MNLITIKPGDIVELKKGHPCGANRWQVEKIGLDVWLRCQECRRLVKIYRSTFDKQYKKHLEA
jgi:hypothetical protein